MKPTYEELFEKNRALTQQLQVAQDALLKIQETLLEVETLKEKIKELEEKLNTNSRNSSKSSSQDPNRQRKKKKPSERKQGAQKGHKGTSRVMVKPDEVTEFKDVHPNECPHCGGKNFDDNPIFTEKRQVTELPEIQPEVTQYNIHTCTCTCCGKSVKAKTPPEAPMLFKLS